MNVWWQHLPEHMTPVAFAIGSFSIRFYSLSWIFGFFGVWLFLLLILKRDGRERPFHELVFSGLAWVFFGAFVGGRLGYALLYAPEYFWHHPSALVSPFDNGVFVGFFGMSFFGGIAGALLAFFFFLRNRKSEKLLFDIADYYALAVPIAIFFGRIGNFFNGELYGRVTAMPWGMYFPLGGALLRHPSELYEAALEGVVLFISLFLIRSYAKRAGIIAGSFMFLYGILRFFAEFFREPDFGSSFVFGYFTFGQCYSFVLILLSLWFLCLRKGVILKS